MRSRLKRLILALGVGAVIGLIISLIRRLTPPRLTHETGSEQPPATDRLTSSGQEAVPAAASAGQEAAVATRKLKARKHSGMFGGGGNQFAAFVSHAKADASMEARYLQTELEKRTRRRVFLDSDDLRDLSQLTAHVLDSDVIIVVQSANVLSRPYCLLELYTAITQGVPVVGVSLASGSAAHSYSFEESARFLTHLDSLLEQNNPGASQLLTQNGVDMEHCAYVLSCTLPKIISTKLEPGASQNILQATLDDIAATMRNASLPTLPPKEEWRRSRNAAAFTGPTLTITLTESLTVTLTLTESLTLTLSLNPTPTPTLTPAPTLTQAPTLTLTPTLIHNPTQVPRREQPSPRSRWPSSALRCPVEL